MNMSMALLGRRVRLLLLGVCRRRRGWRVCTPRMARRMVPSGRTVRIRRRRCNRVLQTRLALRTLRIIVPLIHHHRPLFLPHNVILLRLLLLRYRLARKLLLLGRLHRLWSVRHLQMISPLQGQVRLSRGEVR